jgi:predicted DNA-binding transcriptional regulator YafY
MARGEQLGRQWKIIQRLIASPAGIAASDMAESLGCHSRTVYRDLEALQLGGFPLYTDRVDGRNLWFILDSVRHQPPIPFSLTELMALYFSRDMLKSLKKTVFYESLETLFEKIKATVGTETLAFLERVEQSLAVAPEPHKEYGRFRETLSAVNEAVFNRRYIEIVYHTMSRDKTSRRRVAPYKIWFFDATFYLIGYCSNRKDIRIFAVDRIEAITETEETFEIPEGFDLEAFMRGSFGVFVGTPETVRIQFSSKVAGYIREKIWHASQRLEELPGGGVELTAEVAVTDELRFWVMKWGGGARVLEPDSLREAVAREARDMLARYGSDEPFA